MANNNEKKLNGTVIVTYRCNARCSMCNRYKAPSKPEEEISIETIKKLPKMYFTNITGGEPFIRTDLKDIVRELYKKSDRIVISTNGFFTDRIVDLCKEFPQIGIRISIEGLEQTNNEIRGLQNGYQRGYGTLLLCTTASTSLRLRTSSTTVRWLQRISRIWSTNCSAAIARRSGSVLTSTTA